MVTNEQVKALLKEERALCWTFAWRWCAQAEAPASLVERFDREIAKVDAYTLTDADLEKKVQVLKARGAWPGESMP